MPQQKIVKTGWQLETMEYVMSWMGLDSTVATASSMSAAAPLLAPKYLWANPYFIIEHSNVQLVMVFRLSD